MAKFSLSLLFLPGLLIGCSSICEVEPINVPDLALESAIESANQDPLFIPSARLPKEWWLIFDDSQLTEFVEKAIQQNPNLQSALSRIQSAFSVADRVKSALFPYIGWGGDVSRQKLSKTGVIPFPSGAPGSGTPVIGIPDTTSAIPEYFTQYETEFNLKYDFDFWNKNRNTFRAALGQAQANIAEFAYAELQLGISVAKTYYELQTDFERRKVVQALVENRKKYLELVQRRVKGNVDTELSVQTAEFNMVDSEDILLQIEGEIAVNQYQLMAYLAGSFDEEILPMAVASNALPKIPLPQNLPLHLIANRPDITAQLWLIESAGKQIEVAKAGFYPDFNITALVGFQTIHLAKLFKWPDSLFFIADPAFSLPIFDGGRLIAELEGSHVNYNLAILNYNQLVLDATQDVLTTLAVLRNQSERMKAYEDKLKYQTEFNRLTSLRVAHNLSSRLDELTSEGYKLVAEDQEIIARGKMIQAILNLINALGGGYDSDCN